MRWERGCLRLEKDFHFMNPGAFLLLEDLILFTLPEHGHSQPAGPARIGALAGDGKQLSSPLQHSGWRVPMAPLAVSQGAAIPLSAGGEHVPVTIK